MPPGKHGKKALVSSGRDGIDGLPDGVLEHILGFLPAEEAVRTCLLARRWRSLWKSAAGLCITFVTWKKEPASAKERKKKFVDHLLQLRGRVPLESCELRFGSSLFDYDAARRMCGWFPHVVMCQVRMLRLEYFGLDALELDDPPLVSRYLKRLELVGVVPINNICDFSGCPSLEYLEIAHSNLTAANKISSESLKRQSITSCDMETEFPILINVPSLVSLRLDSHLSRAPVLTNMPSLQDAFVRVAHENFYPWDCYCDDYSRDCDDEDCYSCHGILDDNNRSKCVLLEVLKEAENLALISESITFTFERDLKQCPTFSKLKILLLNDRWCVAPEFPALTCILKNSPILEKLTLQLFSKGPKHNVEMIGRYHPMDRSAAISAHLKVIQVKCEMVDEKVHEILELLSTFNICKRTSDTLGALYS